MATATSKVLHIRHKGRSRDVPLSELDIGDSSTDEEIKRATANFLDINVAELEDHAVQKHKNGNMTIHPQAVFG